MHPLRRFDPASGILEISAKASHATQTFQLLHQVALLTQSDLLDATLDLARFQSDESRAIAKIGLANYFAGAALLPYRRFLSAAQSCRHDLETLADQFGASLEQVAHRLSTLQRPGAKGVPFFLRAGRSGGHDHQAPFRHAPAIRALRGRLPPVECASRV